MCRNIKTLYNFNPPATEEEINQAALQFVRKISGYTHPSHSNKAAFDRAVAEISASSAKLLSSLVTTAAPKDREAEIAKAHARAVKKHDS